MDLNSVDSFLSSSSDCSSSSASFFSCCLSAVIYSFRVRIRVRVSSIMEIRGSEAVDPQVTINEKS